MKQNIIHISIEDFLKHKKYAYSFEDKLIIDEMSGQKLSHRIIDDGTFLRMDVFSIFLIQKGSMDITIDNTNYHLSANSLLHIMDLHVIKNVALSEDFKGYQVIIDRSMFAEIMLNSRRMPAVYIASIRVRPILKLIPHDINLLINCVQRIIWNINRTGHAWQRDMVLNELRGFLLEMSNIIYQSNKDKVNPASPGKDVLLFLFIQLLNQHCRKEHAVTFYAKELCISPEYLSRITKMLSGKTANQWIAEALMREAEMALRDPDYTIQEVSDLLNFSDQSAFGKFFKKHKHISPLAFKKQTQEF